MSRYGMDQKTFSDAYESILRMQEFNTPKLPPYDSEETCPKCGCDAARVMTDHHFFSPTWPVLPAPRRGMPCDGKMLVIGDHLCRTCGRCGYSWQERAVDSEANDGSLGDVDGSPSVASGEDEEVRTVREGDVE